MGTRAKRAVEFQCGCGQVKATLSAQGASSGTRLRCYCTDCQTAARHLGYDLPSHGGSELIHTTPDAISIDQGAEHLAILRLGPKGLCRWYASCCKTPMFNTLPRKSLPFAGIVVHPAQAEATEQQMGPVWGHAFTASAPAGGGAPAQDKHMMGIGARIVGRLITAYLSGRAAQNPFLTKDKDWIAPVTVLTLEQRKAAQP